MEQENKIVKSTIEFIETLGKLDPLSAIGVFEILDVHLDPEDPQIENRIGDLIDSFTQKNRQERRTLLREMKRAAGNKRVGIAKQKGEQKNEQSQEIQNEENN